MAGASKRLADRENRAIVTGVLSLDMLPVSEWIDPAISSGIILSIRAAAG